MSLSEERLRILKMVEEGTITTEEGVKLLEALRSGEQSAEPGMGGTDKRWFRVRVTDVHTGEVKVSVNVPVRLVEVGARMGARFVPKVAGIDVDEIMQRIHEGEIGKLIDALDPDAGERFEVTVE